MSPLSGGAASLAGRTPFGTGETLPLPRRPDARLLVGLLILLFFLLLLLISNDWKRMGSRGWALIMLLFAVQMVRFFMSLRW
jgi:hypothetical protein